MHLLITTYLLLTAAFAVSNAAPEQLTPPIRALILANVSSSFRVRKATTANLNQVKTKNTNMHFKS